MNDEWNIPMNNVVFAPGTGAHTEQGVLNQVIVLKGQSPGTYNDFSCAGTIELIQETDIVPAYNYCSSIDSLDVNYFGCRNNMEANQDTKYTYSLGNSLVSQITFSDSTCVGDGDTLKVYDGTGKLVGTYTDCDLAGKTLEIMGSTVTVELISDSGDNSSYGFSISKITGVPYSILPLMWEAMKKVK
jgi:hypothetical protein